MTAEQLHDALGLLPSDLIAGADAWRACPRRKAIPWKRRTALAACAALMFTCGYAVTRSGLLGFSGGSTEKLAVTQAECAPESPAAMAPTQAAGDTCDSISQITNEAEEAPAPTYGVPPVDVAAAEFRFGELSLTDEIYLVKNPDGLIELGLEPDIYDEGWFADFDLLLISLPGVTSPDALEISVGQGMDPHHWEIRIGNLLEERADCTDSLLICIPVQKGHIPRDAEFTLIP